MRFSFPDKPYHSTQLSRYSNTTTFPFPGFHALENLKLTLTALLDLTPTVRFFMRVALKLLMKLVILIYLLPSEKKALHGTLKQAIIQKNSRTLQVVAVYARKNRQGTLMSIGAFTRSLVAWIIAPTNRRSGRPVCKETSRPRLLRKSSS